MCTRRAHLCTQRAHLHAAHSGTDPCTVAQQRLEAQWHVLTLEWPPQLPPCVVTQYLQLGPQHEAVPVFFSCANLEQQPHIVDEPA